jgi:hypothetical protein
MSNLSRRFSTAVTLSIGVALGWGLAGHKPPIVKAGGGDRFGEDVLTAGPVAIQYNERTKTQAAQDAIYYLDYRGGRLMAMVPAEKQTAQGSQMVSSFAERDLAADFKLDPDRGARPHFLMTPGSLGAYGEGWSPLFVFETTTKQVAVYKLQAQAVGTKASSKFELMEVKSFAAMPPLPGSTP